MRWGMFVLCCSLPVISVFAADPVPRAPRTKVEIDQQLSLLAQRQVELAFTLRDQLQKNDTLWMDPKYTSPEIEALRKRLHDLQRELVDLQMALRTRVAELPAAQAEIGKAEQVKTAHQALARQITALQQQREQAP